MSRLTAEERAAVARELVALIERYRDDLFAVAIKHGLSPEALVESAAPAAGWELALDALRKEAGL